MWTRPEEIPNQLVGIPAGARGTRATLALMARLADDGSRDPLVRQWAIGVLQHARVAPHDHAGELAAIFRAVRDGIRFTRDPDNLETLQTPRRTLQWRAGDCDDFSTLLAAALRSIGTPARLAFRVIGSKPGRFGHVYVVARLAGRDVPLDGIYRGTPLGWQYPRPAVREDYPLWATP